MASSYFPAVKSEALIMWSSRDSRAHSTTDIITSSDVVDILGLGVSGNTRYTVWFSEMRKVEIFAGTIADPVPIALVVPPPHCHEVNWAMWKFPAWGCLT
ncbi:hypothetical protein V1524DRAFT_412327, partial [Lipomyces starkeyi]